MPDSLPKSLQIAASTWDTTKFRETKSLRANQKVINREIEIRGLNAIHKAWAPDRLQNTTVFTIAVENANSVFMQRAEEAYAHVARLLSVYGGTVSKKYARVGKSLPMRLVLRAVVTNVLQMKIKKVRSRLGHQRTVRAKHEGAPRRRQPPIGRA